MSEESIAQRRERSVREFLEAVRSSPEIQSKLRVAEDPNDVTMVARSFGFYGFRPDDLRVDGQSCILRALHDMAEESGSSIDPRKVDSASTSSSSTEPSEDETLDAAFISNYGIEDFNAELLSNPLTIKENKFLSSMEQKDQSMPLLCPVAKALYYLHRPELKDHLDAGLSNVIIADPRASVHPTHEEVAHVITKSLGDKKILLEFRSTAEFIWADEDSGDSCEFGLAIGSLRDWKPDPESGLTKDDFIAWLKEISRDSGIHPLGDPVDEGPFVCYLTYRLSAVNGIAIKSQAHILSSAHELEFKNCTQANAIDIPDSTDGKFNWTILLGKSGLKKLLGEEAWLSNAINTSLDQLDTRDTLRISVDEIHESYKATSITRKSAKYLYLLLGSGSGWEPGFEGTAEDDGHADSRLSGISYPATHPPLQIHQIRLDGKNLKNNGFEECFRIIEPLIQATARIA
jgi:hypothetical protein